MYDALIIGGGVCGAAIAMHLSKYEIECCLVERENDIAMGTTKANSGIIHAGYDPEPGTLMAKLNVRGNEMAHTLCKDLGVPFKAVGSLVVAFDDGDLEHIKRLYDRGVENGVQGMSILDGEEVASLEPSLSPEIKGALYAPSAGVVNPWQFCIAMAEAAAANGVEFKLGAEVTAIEKLPDRFRVTAGGEIIEAAYVINAAGVYSDKIAALVGANDFRIEASKGQYYLLDKTQSGLVSRVIFQCPTKAGKGVLVSPTADGNVIVGPNSESDSGREDRATDREGLESVSAAAAKTTAKINYRENIRSFAGLRAKADRDDFIIGESPLCERFINVAGIKSPGLTAAPAIGEYVAEIMREKLSPEEKRGWTMPAPRVRFAELSDSEKAEYCKRDPRYGNVICRCNTVTEAEIIAALESRIPARTVDGVKRRAGSGMGRCQGGFCGPRIHEIISRFYGVPAEQVLQDRDGSYIVCGKVGENND